MRRAIAVLMSVAVHAALAARPLIHAGDPAVFTQAEAFGATLTAQAERAAGPVRRDAARRELLRQARAELSRGELHLGDFLLRANAIDAEEAGTSVDLEAVRALYAERLTALRAALLHQELRDAAADVFGDLHYVGDPGGLVADALVDRGGSCEPLAELLVATAYDAGKGREVALRFYGGVSSQGVSHVAPIVAVGPVELDLLTGKPAFEGGTRIPPTELIDVYARAHDLDAKPKPAVVAARGGGKGAGNDRNDEPVAAKSSNRPSMTRGFPENDDRYPGSLPLFASHAFSSGADDREGTVDDKTRAHDTCGFVLGMSVLDPPRVVVDTQGGPLEVEVRRALPATRIDGKASLLAGALENASGKDPTDKLIALACATAVARDLATDFALAGDTKLARLAVETARSSSERATPLLAKLTGDGGEAVQARARLAEAYAGQTWLLLALEGGADVAFPIATSSTPYDWGQIELLAGLVIASDTRARAMAIVAQRPLRDRIDVFHEVFNAHRSLRPWVANYELGDAPSADPGAKDLARAYRVFRHVGYALWVTRAPLDQTLKALTANALKEGLSSDWEAAILEYYARNELGIRQHQEGGMDVVPILRAAVSASGNPSLVPLSRRLAEIEAQGRLDAFTLSEAWRLQ